MTVCSMRRPRAWRLAAPVAALLLSACAQPPVPKDVFYRLEVSAPQAGATAPVFDGKAEVRPLNTDGVLLQRAIAYVPDGARAIEQYSYHFWAEPPAQMVQRELAAYLRSANLFETVVTPELRVRTDYEVQGRLARFEQVLSGPGARFVAEVELAVSQKRGMDLMVMKTYRAEVPAASPSIEDAVVAARRALDRIFADISADLGALR